MANKDTLNKLLDTDEQGIKRGKGLTFSIDEQQKQSPSIQPQPVPPQTTDVISQKRTIAETQKPKRVNRGYALREDIIKRCKSLALDMGKPMYEIMESAMLDYLHKHKK